MKLSRRQMTIAAAVTLLTGTAQAQFGNLGGMLGGGGKASGDVDTDVKAFLGKSINIEKTLNAAALAIVAAYASEADRAKLQGSLDEINKATDPKEADAKFQAVSESTSAEMKKLAASSDLSTQTQGLSAAKQKQVAVGVGNFLWGALQAKDLVPTGQAVMKGVSGNPMNITKVIPVKDALPRLVNAMSLAADTIPQFVKVMQGANIKVAEVSSSSKEEKIESLQ
jgi:hypothetical protein